MVNNEHTSENNLSNDNQLALSTSLEFVISDDYRNKVGNLALSLSKISPHDNFDDPEMPSNIIRGRE